MSAQAESYEEILRRERLILEATELITELMEDRGISRAELSRLMGTSKAYVTQMLNGQNMSLGTIAHVFGVLGARVHLHLEVEE